MSSVPTGDLPESGSGQVELGQDVIASSTSPYVVPEYVTLIGRIQRHVVPRTYIEVGVATGRTLALAAPGSVAIGVDPEPHLTLDLDDGARVFETTSDAFFDEEDVRAIMGNREIDLAFIDGMHRFEFALRDFMNIERLSSRDTVVLIHDCLPVDEVSARRERETKFWTGDVWKLIVCLKEWRPESGREGHRCPTVGTRDDPGTGQRLNGARGPLRGDRRHLHRSAFLVPRGAGDDQSPERRPERLGGDLAIAPEGAAVPFDCGRRRGAECLAPFGLAGNTR